MTLSCVLLSPSLSLPPSHTLTQSPLSLRHSTASLSLFQITPEPHTRHPSRGIELCGVVEAMFSCVPSMVMAPARLYAHASSVSMARLSFVGFSFIAVAGTGPTQCQSPCDCLSNITAPCPSTLSSSSCPSSSFATDEQLFNEFIMLLFNS